MAVKNRLPWSHNDILRLVEAPPPSSGVLPSRQSIGCVYILAHLLRRCTRLLMVLPSRQQSAMCSLVSYEDGSHIFSIHMHSGA
ncbi:MAG: hypothetical protein MR951_03115 [Paraprevotella sp.]|nr:hypothetical protein [Paraprevotella sp.]